MNIYGPNFAMPIQNFALVTPPAALASAAAAAATASGSSNQSEKKAHQPQQQGLKTGVDSLPHSFAIYWQPHLLLRPAAQKNFRISEDGKSGCADSCHRDERKSLAGKAPGGVGQSIAFTRSDLADAPVIQANSVIESSARSLNVSSGPARSSRSGNQRYRGYQCPNAHIQAQLHQQQMLQLKQQHQQQQQLAATAVNRSKVPVSSNGSIYSEHLIHPAMAAKFPNALSGFPQNLIQSNSSSPTQSPQWKSSQEHPTSQSSSPLVSSTTTTLKNLPQQHSRPQSQMHTQISFGGNQKPSTTSQGQAPPSSNQAPSSPMVGSPTTSSISKGASGSPKLLHLLLQPTKWVKLLPCQHSSLKTHLLSLDRSLHLFLGTLM
ncbi:UNVERIFIED_CONTAM: protein TIME FOR COFFEE [Sesamum radiatum]|uniref:Protein TIME FOR COFFEE n=1 Tax=Sesamum radiatum TaxID=300843 RepID=A0AAW2UB85_SESRA